MPQFESEPTLSVKYYESGTYTYDELTLLSALPDASQIEVRWDVNTVYGGAGQTGTIYNVDDLDSVVQQEIKTLTLNTQFTIDQSSNTVTIIPAAIEDQAITTSSGTFYYPSTFSISSSQFLEIRRATDITYRVVDFQPGSRLTSENLNLANSQVFNAIQELTEFGFGGQGGSITDIDLSNSSVTDLGDVTFNTGVTGLVQWNSATQQMENSGSADGLVPDNEGLSDTNGQVLMSSFIVGEPNTTPSFDWEWLTTAEVFTSKIATTTLASVLNDIEADIVSVENVTSDMSRPSIPGATFFDTDDVNLTAGDLIMTAGDVNVQSGDVLIQGESVHDYITHEPYFWQFPTGDSTNLAASGDIKTLGSTDFTNHTAFQYASSTASADFNFTSGVWTAPRDMVVSVSLTWAVTLQGGATTASSLGRIFHNGANVGGPIYNNNDNNVLRRSATKTVVLNVSANDTITCVVERDGGNVFSVENAEACLHEVR